MEARRLTITGTDATHKDATQHGFYLRSGAVDNFAHAPERV